MHERLPRTESGTGRTHVTSRYELSDDGPRVQHSQVFLLRLFPAPWPIVLFFLRAESVGLNRNSADQCLIAVEALTQDY
jgi:hypothetical protein